MRDLTTAKGGPGLGGVAGDAGGGGSEGGATLGARHISSAATRRIRRCIGPDGTATTTTLKWHR